MNKFVKYGVTAVGSLFAGAVTMLLMVDKEDKKISATTKFQCENCPYGEGTACLENDRILNPEDFMVNTPIVVLDYVLNYYPKRILRPLCLKFLCFDYEKSRVVCYSFKQEKLIYINVDYEDIDNVKITVTAG